MSEKRNAIIVQTGPPSYEGWVKLRDAATAAQLLCCAIAAITPQCQWKGISSALAQIHLLFRHSRQERLADVCSRYLGLDPTKLERGTIAAEYEKNIEAIREILPGGWQPRIVLRGSKAIDEAREERRGAVLWVSRFAHSDLVTKRALATAGYRVTHLSHFGHPFSTSRLGSMLLNPIRLAAEDRYLERRVFVTYGTAKPAIDILKGVLLGNGVVTVTATGAGRRAITLPLLDGSLRLAMGAPSLALDTGAALIPVYTVPDQEGGYSVHCGPDLNAGQLTASDEVLHAIAQHYANLLENFIRAHPTNWQGWFSDWKPRPQAAVAIVA